MSKMKHELQVQSWFMSNNQAIVKQIEKFLNFSLFLETLLSSSLEPTKPAKFQNI